MDDFTRLMKGTIYEHKTEIEDVDRNDFYLIDGELSWPCRVCQEIVPINCEPEDFDESMNYCGGSPACCP